MKHANVAAHHGRANSKQPRSLSVDLLPFDIGWNAACVRSRDREWERKAFAQGVELKPPPFPAELHPQLNGQRIFTAADVAELLTKALARRDQDWLHWCADSLERAIHPTAPPVVGSDQFFGDYLTGGSND